MEGNFSNRVNDVIRLSRDEALRLGHDYIGTEHLLLGVIREGEGIAVKILKDADKGAKRQVAVLNAAYAIRLGKNVADLSEAIEMANTSIQSGSAIEKLKALVTETNGNLVQFKKVFEE